jgi:hypothetical protein
MEVTELRQPCSTPARWTPALSRGAIVNKEHCRSNRRTEIICFGNVSDEGDQGYCQVKLPKLIQSVESLPRFIGYDYI